MTGELKGAKKKYERSEGGVERPICSIVFSNPDDGFSEPSPTDERLRAARAKMGRCVRESADDPRAFYLWKRDDPLATMVKEDGGDGGEWTKRDDEISRESWRVDSRVGASRGPETERRDSTQNALSPPPCSILFVPCIASNAPSSTLMLFSLSLSPARPSLALGPPLHLKFSGREHLDRLCLVMPQMRTTRNACCSKLHAFCMAHFRSSICLYWGRL